MTTTTKTVKRQKVYISKTTTLAARASGFFVHFLAEVARVRRESAGREHRRKIFLFFFETQIQSSRIQFQKNL